MNSLRLIDYLLSTIAGLLGIGWIALFYALRVNSEGVKETAASVMAEKEKSAALVMSEKEKLAALVKTEHDKLDEKFTEFRIRVAEDYVTVSLMEKVLKPIQEHLGKIESLLETKIDRRELDMHKLK